MKFHMEKVHNITEQVRRKHKTDRKCVKCKLTFSSNTLYYRHLKSVHKETKPVQCIACPERFESTTSLNTHKFMHPTLVPFRCDVCRLRYSSKRGLEKHVISSQHAQTSEFGNWNVYTEFDEFDQVCFLCKKKFANYSSFHMHLCFGCITINGSTCNMCKSKFQTMQELQNHLVDEHKLAPEIAAEKIKSKEKALRHTCTLCPKVLNSSSALSYHMKVHRDDKKFKCEKCEYRTVTVGDLKKHMQKHSDEKPFKCSTCNKGFKNPREQKNCMLRHLGDKPHKCNQCPKTFFLKQGLKDHFRRCHSKKSGDGKEPKQKVGLNRADTTGGINQADAANKIEKQKDNADEKTQIPTPPVNKPVVSETNKVNKSEPAKGPRLTTQSGGRRLRAKRRVQPKRRATQTQRKRKSNKPRKTTTGPVAVTCFKFDPRKAPCVVSPCGCNVMISIAKKPSEQDSSQSDEVEDFEQDQSEFSSVPESVDHDHGYSLDVELSSPESILTYRCDCCGKSTVQLIREHQKYHQFKAPKRRRSKRQRPSGESPVVGRRSSLRIKMEPPV